MKVFKEKISRWKFMQEQIWIVKCIVICVRFSKMYIWAYNVVIWSFWMSVVKDNENCLLVFKNRVSSCFLALGV